MGEGLKHIKGNLSEGGFEGRMSTGSEAFPLLICLDANKSVLAIVFSLIENLGKTTAQECKTSISGGPCIVQERLCVSPLMKKYR